MSVTAMLARAVHQPLDLAFGEIAPLNCQVYDAWRAFLGCRFHADKLSLPASYCICYTLFLHSIKERLHGAHRDRNAGWRRRGGCGDGAAARAARPASFCLAAKPLYGTPPVGGTFRF